MPAYRIGFGSDFNLSNQFVGIGTTTADVRLEVINVLKGDFNITGVATLTSYGGFAAQKQLGDDDTITGEVNSISEDIVVSVGKTFTVSVGATVYPGTLESVSIGTHFSFPNGGIAARPEEPVEGMVRFNDDLNTLEFYNGVEWRQFTVDGSSGRGVFVGGSGPGNLRTLKYINIASRGNSLDFGSLTSNWLTGPSASFSSSTRGIFAGGGDNTSGSNVIEYITIASQGNSIDFGDLTIARTQPAGASSSTRGLIMGGYVATPGIQNVIDYVQISTIGNAVDFGDIRLVNIPFGDSAASPTRAVILGGTGPGFTYLSSVDYVNIASKGNSIQYGEWIFAGAFGCGAQSNSIRAIKAGGFSFATGGANSCSLIGAITIATGGNAINFGDLRNGPGQDNRTYFAGQGGAASATRGIFYNGGESTTPTSRAITSIELETGGSPTYFGDAGQPNERFHSGLSDSHGGLGGF